MYVKEKDKKKMQIFNSHMSLGAMSLLRNKQTLHFYI